MAQKKTTSAPLQNYKATHQKEVKNQSQKREVMIEAKKLYKTFTNGTVETKVLKNLNFKIHKGEFVGIMGPSGSGKSTCLYQLSLLDAPTSGDVFIDGVNVAHLDDDEKTQFRLLNVGYVFQQYRVLPELTVLENVMLPLKMKGASKKEYMKRARELLEQVGLKDRITHFPSELSGGQQQRVAIARSLINTPIILFADEPTANLDTTTSDEVLKLFKKFNTEMGQTIVMVSHDLEQIKYFDRVIHLVDGEIDSEDYKLKR